MIDTDPLIAEIRLTRQAISAEFNHDPKLMYAYYQHLEQELRATGKYFFVEADKVSRLTKVGLLQPA
jgi:hypothetical protein